MENRPNGYEKTIADLLVDAWQEAVKRIAQDLSIAEMHLQAAVRRRDKKEEGAR